MLTCTKTYVDFPFAHRAPLHDGHCALVHGHNWTFDITFAAAERDANGFVMDFGKLHDLKSKLDHVFDHTLLLNRSDPLLEPLRDFLTRNLIDNVRVVADCSCEGIALLVYEISNTVVRAVTGGRVHVAQVIVWEDSKNSAAYEPNAKSK